MLQFLNKRVDPDDEHHIVRMRDCFLWRKHLCLVFELLSVNLYELLKHNHFKGLSLGLLTIFIAQVSKSSQYSNCIFLMKQSRTVYLPNHLICNCQFCALGSLCSRNSSLSLH